MNQMEQIKKISDENNGVIQTSVVLKKGISKPVLAKYVEEFGYERVSHGIYCSPDVWEDGVYLLQLRCPKIIFSHETALYLLNMTDQEPHNYTVTVNSGYNATHLRRDDIKVYSIKNELFELGAVSVKTSFGNQVKIYNPERTVCDLLRNRSTVEIQIFKDAMKEYMQYKEKNLHLLMKYAKEFRVSNVLRKYLEVLL